MIIILLCLQNLPEDAFNLMWKESRLTALFMEERLDNKAKDFVLLELCMHIVSSSSSSSSSLSCCTRVVAIVLSAIGAALSSPASAMHSLTVQSQEMVSVLTS